MAIAICDRCGRQWLSKMMADDTCPFCEMARLRKEPQRLRKILTDLVAVAVGEIATSRMAAEETSDPLVLEIYAKKKAAYDAALAELDTANE